MKERRHGIALATAGILAISTDSLFTRAANVSSFDIVFWAGVFSAGVMLGVLVFDRTTPLALLRRDGKSLLLAACLQALTTTLFILAVKNTSVANVVVIIAASPLAAAIVSWFWLRERTAGRVWAGIAVSMAGICLVLSGSLGGGNFQGDLLALAAIIAFGFSVTLLRGRPTMSRTMIVGLGALIMAAVAAWPATFSGYTTQTWLALLAMGAIFGPAGRLMLGTASRYLPAAEVALFAPLETVFAMILAMIFLSEIPTAATWLGGLIVIAGVLWAIWPRERPAAIIAPAARK